MAKSEVWVPFCERPRSPLGSETRRRTGTKQTKDPRKRAKTRTWGPKSKRLQRSEFDAFLQPPRMNIAVYQVACICA